MFTLHDQWFSGLPVVGERTLRGDEWDRFHDLRARVQRETLTASLVALLLIAGLIAYVFLNMVYIWLGIAGLYLSRVVAGWLPKARIFPLRVHRGLRRDQEEGLLVLCQEGDLSMEILAGSHLIWTRNGEPTPVPYIAHRATTAAIPAHAHMAANFVQPVDWNPDLLVHRRVMTPGEQEELDAFAPEPLLALLMLAIVGAIGSVASFGLALAGRVTTLLPPFLFAIFALFSARSWMRARRQRKRIAADLEAAFIIIIRDATSDPPGPPEEILPFSHAYWTIAGKPAQWRMNASRG